MAIGFIANTGESLSCNFSNIRFGIGVQASAQTAMNGSSLKRVLTIFELAKSVLMPINCFAVSAIAERSEWKKIIQPKPTIISV